MVTVKFSPDGSRFAAASKYSGFCVYSTHNGDTLFDSGSKCATKSHSAVTPLAWSPYGQQLFAASKGKITCLNVSNASFSEWSIHETQSRVSVASNGRFVVCSARKSISLWDCMSHKLIGSFIIHTTVIYCIALSPNGGYLPCGVGTNISIHNLRDVLPWKYFVTGLLLIQVSGETVVSSTQDDPTNTEMLLPEQITSTSSPSYHPLANRVLM